MDLIIGGAYQGKLDYAREKFSIRDSDIFLCSSQAEIDTTRRCIYHFEEYVLFCVRSGKVPELIFRDDAVIICDDISCGVVPMSAENRLWREETGRALVCLARQAESVTRVFCGLPHILK